MTFQTNYLSHFLLIDRLLSRGGFNAHARIVNVSSLTHWQETWTEAEAAQAGAPADRDSFSPFFAYCKAKLAQVLYTRQLNAVLRAQRSTITVLAVHPVRTEALPLL